MKRNKIILSSFLVFLMFSGILAENFDYNYIENQNREKNQKIEDIEIENMNYLDTNNSIHNDYDLNETPLAGNLASWWDEDFDWRVKLNVVEPGINDRYNEPISFYINFDEGACHINSTRIIFVSGNVQTEIPSQIWNISIWSENPDYIKSASITFITSIQKEETKMYYIYYSSQQMWNNTNTYFGQTGFESTLTSGRATVNTGNIHVEFAQGTSFDVLKLNSESTPKNYHTPDSMSPSAHLDEGGPYTPDERGFFRDWMITGPFSICIPETDANWNNNASTINGNHVNTSIEYKPGDNVISETPAIWGSDETKTWTTHHSTSERINFNNLFSPNTYVAGYAMVYVHIPQDEPTVYMKIGSDDGVRVVYNLGTQVYYNHVARGVSTDNDVVQINGGMDAGWHSFLVLIEERTGGWGFEFRLSRTPGLGDENFTPIPGLTMDFEKPKVNIQNIQILQEGPIFSQYHVEWEESGDMHTNDIVTFYAGSNMYKFERIFGWDSNKNEESGNQNWTAFNTYYPSTSTTDADRFVVDGTIYPISSSGLVGEDYIFTYDYNKGNLWLTQGVFITKSYAQDPVLNTFTQINSTTRFNSNRPEIISGYQTDLDYTAPSGGYAYSLSNPYNIRIEFWEFIDKYISAGSEDNIGVELYNYYEKILNPVEISVDSDSESLFFNLEFKLYDTDLAGAHGVNITLFNSTNDWSGIHYNVNSENSFEPLSLQSNSTGGLIFPELKGANYTAIVSYQAYDKPSINFTSLSAYKHSCDKWETNIAYINVTLNTTQKISVYHLNLTTIEISLTNYDAPLEPGSAIVGANVSLYWNNTDLYGNAEDYGGYIGSAQSDIDGRVNFYYFNSSEAEGNYTIKVKYFGNYRKINDTVEDVNAINTMINFTASSYTYLIAHVQLSTFDTFLSATAGPDISPLIYWKEDVNILYNYSWSYGSQSGPIADASIFYELYSVDNPSKGLIKSGVMSKTEISGIYNLTFNSSDPSFSLNTNENFRIDFYAESAGFTPKSRSTVFSINDITTELNRDVSMITNPYWRQNFTLRYYFNDTLNNYPVESAILTYSVNENPLINGVMVPELESGWYSVTLNSTDFEFTDSYSISILAQKEYYVQKQDSVNIQIRDIETVWEITSDSYNENFGHYEVSWNSEILVSINYREKDGDVGINTGATISWAVSEREDINGQFVLNSSLGDGWYSAIIDSTDFPYAGYYVLELSADRTNFEERTRTISLFIQEIYTLLDGRAAPISNDDIYRFQSKNYIFEYSYRDPIQGLIPVENAVYATYELSSLSDTFEYEQIGTLIYDGSLKKYILDIKSEELPIGSYSVAVRLQEINHIARVAVLYLNVVPRQFVLNINNQEDFDSSSILRFEREQNQNVNIKINLTEKLDGYSLENAVVIWRYGSTETQFVAKSGGIWEIDVVADLDAFFQQQVMNGEIIISADNFQNLTINTQITVLMPEIFEGVPTFYFIIVVSAAGLIVLSLVVNNAIANAKIPGFVKLITATEKQMKSKKDLSSDSVTVSVEDEIIERYGEHWEALDLNLTTILKGDAEHSNSLTPGDIGGNE